MNKPKQVQVGLLATQAIRGQANREVLRRIVADLHIFLAYSDRDWILEGAEVHVSIIGFQVVAARRPFLNGAEVSKIYPDLSAGVEGTSAGRLAENLAIAFQGPVKVGKFELIFNAAHSLLCLPNPSTKSNSDVLSPYVTGAEIADRFQGEWIIDFGTLSEGQAALYEGVFEHVRKIVKPARDKTRDRRRRERWWLHGAAGSEMKSRLRPLRRYIGSSRHAKDWLFRFIEPCNTFPDSGVVAFARADDYFFGVLQSSVHELWCAPHGHAVARSGIRLSLHANDVF